MSIYTNVPLIKQEKSMSCWHASARMLWAFKYRQSINPLNHVYHENLGISSSQFVELAKSVGLKAVPKVNMSYSWTMLASLLTLHGPLWAAGNWYGPNHIIVITGVSPNGTVYVNDPAGFKKKHDMLFINSKIAKNVDSPILYLPNSRANEQGFGTYFQ